MKNTSVKRHSRGKCAKKLGDEVLLGGDWPYEQIKHTD